MGWNKTVQVVPKLIIFTLLYLFFFKKGQSINFAEHTNLNSAMSAEFLAP